MSGATAIGTSPSGPCAGLRKSVPTDRAPDAPSTRRSFELAPLGEISVARISPAAKLTPHGRPPGSSAWLVKSLREVARRVPGDAVWISPERALRRVAEVAEQRARAVRL